MKLKFLFFTLFICAAGFSQNKGTITGVLLDKDANNQSLPFANVMIKDTKIGVNTDVDGKYTLQLDAGNYTVQFSFLGYESLEVSVTVVANETITLNNALGSGSYKLKDVVIKSSVGKQKESALLLQQKNAVAFKAAIGAEEISRKGINDVANAVTKVSGISKQEDTGNVFVRGLGDRYNVTTLNGLPLPSNNPANKNITLDIFTTSIVDNIGISKTFEVQNYADFAGASIDISSKKFSGKPFVAVSIATGANTNVLGQDHFYLQDGPTYFGFKTVGVPEQPLKPYDHATSWDRQTSDNILNGSYTLSAGKKFNIGEEGSLSTFVTGSFSAKNKFTQGYSRGSITSDGDIQTDYYRLAYMHNTTTTVMGTADYKINSKNSILFTSLFVNSSDQTYSEYSGTNVNFDGGGATALDQISGFVKRGTFERTQLYVNQLVGNNKFNDQWNLNWAAGYSISNNSIPDRMENTFVHAANGVDYTFFTNSNIDNHRFFQTLDEKEFSANVTLSYNFNKNSDDKYEGKATFGYSGRLKNVDYNTQQYSFFPNRNNYSFAKEGIHNVDFYLNQMNYENAPSNRIKQSYNGDLTINAGFASVQYTFPEKLSVILGARLEQTIQSVDFYSTIKPKGDRYDYSKFNVLPSLISKYTLNDKQNLKFSLSKTYTLPQFKEIVEIAYEDVTQAYVGNSNLYASTDYNIDLGWEFFPKSGELISVTGFGKIIQNPINEMFLNSSSNDITYANTGEKAKVAGIELEYRKDIFELENNRELKTKLSFDVNGSYIYTNQDLSIDKVNAENDFGANFTFTEAKLTGASDFLANANISFFKELAEDLDLTTTISYSYFSDKLAVIGTSRVGNMVDKAINKLDFIVNSSLTKNIKIGIIYNNILNPTFERVLEQGQVPGKSAIGDVLVTSYKAGSDIRLTFNYTF